MALDIHYLEQKVAIDQAMLDLYTAQGFPVFGMNKVIGPDGSLTDYKQTSMAVDTIEAYFDENILSVDTSDEIKEIVASYVEDGPMLIRSHHSRTTQIPEMAYLDVEVGVYAEPSIVIQPLDCDMNVSGATIFEATASGFPHPDLVWQRKNGEEWVDIPVDGSTNKPDDSILTIRQLMRDPTLETDLQGQVYRLLATNPLGSVTSDEVVVSY